MGDVQAITAKLIAASLTESQRKAVCGFFLSDADGEILLAKGVFASREGWPLTKLGEEVRGLVLPPLPRRLRRARV